ncbi:MULTISPECIES: hypothetical protein [Weeksella]|uniref:PspC family transcriptional regulator n=1 Tax=Weeksella virosa (strain ATCC 43766 / DSM 16922 / JCM 21250 / CCUG 30538 / CDC 9751 / IAM 14551 / NBRC 16016 / NCTC 11634 / CL345/78) TaxID=865938 RepID=F0P039_WEEVC|nr:MULTISPECIES: hypothetical protein [Weeksella]ADX67386.1 hypothetical protein Weevi_0671 [Weeksella virosa DSM 16922]MDK7374385.1 PspC family transcriptional regulator [Weeksella virosa]MDK7675667.1 PspC family transcriptional regulator [Weeksella virosa]OFM81974.1 PspC family transcriptional regulator [Weeksella sp. HMSC059D05]SUP53677.1 Uncharacterised protein [Weeksella virosa]
MLDKLRNITEISWFNVIERIADKIGVRVAKLRLLYIYLAFATLGIAFIIYFVMAFALWVKDCFVVRRKSVFDL